MAPGGSAMCLPISEQRRDMPQDMWRTHLYFVTVMVTLITAEMHVDLEALSRGTNTESTNIVELHIKPRAQNVTSFLSLHLVATTQIRAVLQNSKSWLYAATQQL
jgi:hypothetical protein